MSYTLFKHHRGKQFFCSCAFDRMTCTIEKKKKNDNKDGLWVHSTHT